VQEMQNIETKKLTSFVMVMVSPWNDVSILFFCLHSCSDNEFRDGQKSAGIFSLLMYISKFCLYICIGRPKNRFYV